MKMHFIRNIEDLRNGAKSHVTEYEVTTDCKTVGEFVYGPYYFTIWEVSNKQVGEKRKLCLRIQEKEFDSKDRPWESAKRSGFYHGGGIADEIVALSSLSLRRRFELGPIVRLDDTPRLFSMQKWIDKEIVEGNCNIGYLPDYLKLIEIANSIRNSFYLRDYTIGQSSL